MVHVGLHKTGTSWLQQKLFTQPGFDLPWGKQSSLPLEKLAFDDGLAFDADAARAAICEGREVGSGVPVMTHEDLSSRPTRGDYCVEKVAWRIKAVFPNARILLTVREQRGLIYSLYQQHVRDGDRCTLQEFIGDGTEPDGFVPMCRLGLFENNRLRDTYVRIFGEDAVLVLPLELLGARPQDFADRICRFAGVSPVKVPKSERVNAGLSPAAIEFLRLTNNLFKVANRPPPKWSGYRLSRRIAVRLSKSMPGQKRGKAWREAIDRRIGTSFADSNRRLADAVGLELGDLGYF